MAYWHEVYTQKNRSCRKARGVEFAGALIEASRYDKQQLLPATSSKFSKLFANTVPIYPSSNFSVCNDKAETR